MKLRVLATLLLALAATILPNSAATPAEASHRMAVHIDGDVTNAGLGLTLHVSATGSGTPSSLTGYGVDVPPTGAGVSAAPGNPGVCAIKFTSGSVTGSVATMSGTVVATSEAEFLGAPVTITANASTGAITFVFGPFTFTGTGSVRFAAPVA